MDADTYLQERLQNQIDWYSDRAKTNKRAYLSLRVLELVAAISLPVMAAWSVLAEGFPLAEVTAITGAMVALITGLLSLMKFQENWLQYRTTAESLKHRKYLFLTGSTPYADGALGALVSDVESLVSTENSTWARYMAEGPQRQEQG